MKISVFIPTYNPDRHRLNQTLEGLKNQDFPLSNWELIIVDNNSNIPSINNLDISWHPYAKIVAEPKSGLTYARLKGFKESRANIIIMVDDDNILDQNYLFNTYSTFEQNPNLGAIGGKSIPLFESEPPIWIEQCYGSLAIRDLGENVIYERWEQKYPESAPIGAGMAIRKEALSSYISKIQAGENKITDRKGNSLSSGGDNDIVLEILKSGWEIAYIPSLSLQHIIPKGRMDAKYLGRLNKDSTKSWIHLLALHGINPWDKIPVWTIPLRKLKAWFTYQPWKNNPNFIKYKGVCGMYEALAEL